MTYAESLGTIQSAIAIVHLIADGYGFRLSCFTPQDILRAVYNAKPSDLVKVQVL